MGRFKEKKSLAGDLQPGDATCYHMVVVEEWDVYEVVVLNDGFFDKLTFLKRDRSFYHSHRGENTNPWTIKAAEEMLKRFLGTWEEES
jgi:hypothetical protein